MHRVIFLALLFLSSTLFGQNDSTKKMSVGEELRYEGLANQLRCPTCQGLSVLDSTAPFSNQIKSIVKDQMALGKTDQEVLDFFSTKYGFWILREPPREGFSLLAWILPGFFLVAGTIALWLFYWRSSAQEGVVGNRSEESILKQLQAELDLLRKDSLVVGGGEQ